MHDSFICGLVALPITPNGKLPNGEGAIFTLDTERLMLSRSQMFPEFDGEVYRKAIYILPAEVKPDISASCVTQSDESALLKIGATPSERSMYVLNVADGLVDTSKESLPP